MLVEGELLELPCRLLRLFYDLAPEFDALLWLHHNQEVRSFAVDASFIFEQLGELWRYSVS